MCPRRRSAPAQSRRNLQEAAGQVLIALVSTDGDFSDQVGAVEEEGFWAAALGLVASVSEGAWERKVLGRAQFPGSSPETGMLEAIRGGKLGAGPKHDAVLKKLIEGSRQDRDYLPGAGSKPIQRVGLNTALEIVRQDASIVPREGLPREGVLLITGGSIRRTVFSAATLRPPIRCRPRPLNGSAGRGGSSRSKFGARPRPAGSKKPPALRLPRARRPASILATFRPMTRALRFTAYCRGH